MKDHTNKPHTGHDTIIKDPVAKKQEAASQTIQYTQEQAHEYLDSWKRTQADFENYRKDEMKRREGAIEFGKQTLVEDILEIKDDLEKALQSHEPDEHHLNTGYLDGIKMTLKKFDEVLKRNGVERIPTKGERFNPEKHEAIMGAGDAITQEIRGGYTMNGKVIRPAQVIVG